MSLVIYFCQHIGKSGVKVGRLVCIVTALAQIGRWCAADIANFGTPHMLFAWPVTHFALYFVSRLHFYHSNTVGYQIPGVDRLRSRLIVFLCFNKRLKCIGWCGVPVCKSANGSFTCLTATYHSCPDDLIFQCKPGKSGRPSAARRIFLNR